MPDLAQQKRPSSSAAAGAAATEQAARGPMSAQASPSKGSQMGQTDPAPKTAVKKKSQGLQNYEATLGTYLGPKLYEAVSKELTQEKIGKHAESLVDGAIDFAVGSIGDQLDGISDKDADVIGDALAAQYSHVASDWVNTADGQALVNKLNGWTDANPEAVATIALLAASGAVAANMKIPTLKKKWGITDDLTGSVAVDLGRIQNMGLERVKGRLDYGKGNISAFAQAGYDKEDGGFGSVGLKISF